MRCDSGGRPSKFAVKLRAGDAANSVGGKNASLVKFCDWLRARYPGAPITLSNLAVPGTTPG